VPALAPYSGQTRCGFGLPTVTLLRWSVPFLIVVVLLVAFYGGLETNYTACMGRLFAAVTHPLLVAVPLIALHTRILLADPLPGVECGIAVQVPREVASWPFDAQRTLCMPPGFSISVIARIPQARFLATMPDGRLLVSQPSTGSVLLVDSEDSPSFNVSVFADGLNQPHDLVFHAIDDQMYLYVATANSILRFPWYPGDRTAHDGQVLVKNLPTGSSIDLGGAYAHELKNLAIDSQHRIYVSIASATNADPADRNATPMRGAIYIYDPDGSNGRLFAAGLRNAEGVRFLPGTDRLWAVVNNRDNLAYPFDDGSGAFGQVFQDYVNDHPPDEFTAVRDGGDYGWPFANPNPNTDAGFDNMPFDPDAQNNPRGALFPVDQFDRISKGIPAHSAPLGLTFLQRTNFAPTFAAGAVVTLHGSWNRVPPTGYKVVYFPWNPDTQTPGPQQDFVSGWLDNSTGEYWGRPVATTVDGSGNLLISDDWSGTIYRTKFWDEGAAAKNGF